MKTKSLFNLILKVFGIYFYTKIVWFLPQVIVTIFSINIDDSFLVLTMLLASVGNLLIYLLIGWFLTMKSDWISNKLIQVEENTDINVSSSAIISTALIISGVFIVVDELPNLITQIGVKISKPRFDEKTFYLFASILKIIIGGGLVYTHQWITNKIMKSTSE